MTKTLVDKLKKVKKHLKKTAIIATALSLLRFASCSLQQEEFENTAPKGNLYVEPIYGQAPLEDVVIRYDAEDADGEEDIVEYKVQIDIGNNSIIDETITQSAPIDTKRGFQDIGVIKITGTVKDSYGATDEDSLYVVTTSPEAPTADFTGIDTSLNEEQEKTISLPEPYDPNPEDNPVSYISINGYSSNLNSPVLNENELTLQGKTDETGTYQVVLEIENINGEKAYLPLVGEIFNLVDLSGRLEDNENDNTLRPGLIKIFDSSDNSKLEEIITNDGNFNLQLNKGVSEAILQARLDIGSYVRSIKLNGDTDYSDLIVRAVPYTDLAENEVSIEDFKAHMDEVNFLNIPGLGLHKYNTQNVQIIENNPFDTSISFLDSEIALIKSKMQDVDDIRAFIDGGELNLDESSEKHYDEDFVNKIITPHQGWTIVLPVVIDTTLPYVYENDTEIPNAGFTVLYGSSLPEYNYGRAKILIWEKSEPVISHEFGHALAFPDHALTLPSSKTIMVSLLNLPVPSAIDKKAAKIVYENTYPAREGLDDVLGMGFLDE